MRKPLILGAGVAVLAVTAVGGIAPARAASAPETSDVQALAQARLTLVQAIQIAERQTGGRAVEGALEGEDGRLRYEIALIVGAAEREVVVDARDGAVTAASERSEGRAEHEEDEPD